MTFDLTPLFKRFFFGYISSDDRLYSWESLMSTDYLLEFYLVLDALYPKFRHRLFGIYGEKPSNFRTLFEREDYWVTLAAQLRNSDDVNGLDPYRNLRVKSTEYDYFEFKIDQYTKYLTIQGPVNRIRVYELLDCFHSSITNVEPDGWNGLTIRLIQVSSLKVISYRPQPSELPVQAAPELLFKLFNQQVIEYLSSHGVVREVENYLTWNGSEPRFKTIEPSALNTSRVSQQKITFPKTSRPVIRTSDMSTNVPSFELNPKWLNRPYIVVNEKGTNQLYVPDSSSAEKNQILFALGTVLYKSFNGAGRVILAENVEQLADQLKGVFPFLIFNNMDNIDPNLFVTSWPDNTNVIRIAYAGDDKEIYFFPYTTNTHRQRLIKSLNEIFSVFPVSDQVEIGFYAKNKKLIGTFEPSQDYSEDMLENETYGFEELINLPSFDLVDGEIITRIENRLTRSQGPKTEVQTMSSRSSRTKSTEPVEPEAQSTSRRSRSRSTEAPVPAEKTKLTEADLYQLPASDKLYFTNGIEVWSYKPNSPAEALGVYFAIYEFRDRAGLVVTTNTTNRTAIGDDWEIAPDILDGFDPMLFIDHYTTSGDDGVIVGVHPVNSRWKPETIQLDINGVNNQFMDGIAHAHYIAKQLVRDLTPIRDLLDQYQVTIDGTEYDVDPEQPHGFAPENDQIAQAILTPSFDSPDGPKENLLLESTKVIELKPPRHSGSSRGSLSKRPTSRSASPVRSRSRSRSNRSTSGSPRPSESSRIPEFIWPTEFSNFIYVSNGKTVSRFEGNPTVFYGMTFAAVTLFKSTGVFVGSTMDELFEEDEPAPGYDMFMAITNGYHPDASADFFNNISEPKGNKAYEFTNPGESPKSIVVGPKHQADFERGIKAYLLFVDMMVNADDLRIDPTAFSVKVDGVKKHFNPEYPTEFSEDEGPNYDPPTDDDVAEILLTSRFRAIVPTVPDTEHTNVLLEEQKAIVLPEPRKFDSESADMEPEVPEMPKSNRSRSSSTADTNLPYLPVDEEPVEPQVSRSRGSRSSTRGSRGGSIQRPQSTSSITSPVKPTRTGSSKDLVIPLRAGNTRLEFRARPGSGEIMALVALIDYGVAMGELQSITTEKHKEPIQTRLSFDLDIADDDAREDMLAELREPYFSDSGAITLKYELGGELMELSTENREGFEVAMAGLSMYLGGIENIWKFFKFDKASTNRIEAIIYDSPRQYFGLLTDVSTPQERTLTIYYRFIDEKNGNIYFVRRTDETAAMYANLYAELDNPNMTHAAIGWVGNFQGFNSFVALPKLGDRGEEFNDFTTVFMPESFYDNIETFHGTEARIHLEQLPIVFVRGEESGVITEIHGVGADEITGVVLTAHYANGFREATERKSNEARFEQFSWLFPEQLVFSDEVSIYGKHHSAIYRVKDDAWNTRLSDDELKDYVGDRNDPGRFTPTAPLISGAQRKGKKLEPTFYSNSPEAFSYGIYLFFTTQLRTPFTLTLSDNDFKMIETVVRVFWEIPTQVGVTREQLTEAKLHRYYALAGPMFVPFTEGEVIDTPYQVSSRLYSLAFSHKPGSTNQRMFFIDLKDKSADTANGIILGLNILDDHLAKNKAEHRDVGIMFGNVQAAYGVYLDERTPIRSVSELLQDDILPVDYHYFVSQYPPVAYFGDQYAMFSPEFVSRYQNSQRYFFYNRELFEQGIRIAARAVLPKVKDLDKVIRIMTSRIVFKRLGEQ
jgi:hypothetical protein